MNERIRVDEEINKERWDFYLNANPVKHVEAWEWENKDVISLGGHVGVPLVTIAGIKGTICAGGGVDDPIKIADQDTRDFLCRKLTGIEWATGSAESVSHFNETLVDFPVVVTNIQCPKDAKDFADCTSGPMGYGPEDHCASQEDLKLGCGFGTPPTLVPSE